MSTIVDTAQVFDHDALDAQIVAPDLFDEFGVMASFDVDAAGQRDASAAPLHRNRTRCGPDRGSRTGLAGGCEDHGLPVDEEAGPHREWPSATVPVFELDPAELDTHHRTDVTGLRILDDQPDVSCRFGGPDLPRAMRVAGQYVGAVSIVHPSDPRNVRPELPAARRDETYLSSSVLMSNCTVSPLTSRIFMCAT
jgi:hypothetical protein